MDRFSVKAAPLHADNVKTRKMRVIAGCRTIGNDVRRRRGATANKGVVANPAILMNGAEAAKKRIVPNADMAAQSGVVRHNNVIANQAVMSHVTGGHEHAVITNNGFTTPLRRADIHRHMLADEIILSNDELCVLPVIAEMLWRAAENSKGVNDGVPH